MPRNYDRNDYRCMDTKGPKEQIHYGIAVDWKELAIALSERLDVIRREPEEEYEF